MKETLDIMLENHDFACEKMIRLKTLSRKSGRAGFQCNQQSHCFLKLMGNHTLSTDSPENGGRLKVSAQGQKVFQKAGCLLAIRLAIRFLD